MQDCKVNILGTEYDILFQSREQNRFLNDADGYVDRSVKKMSFQQKKMIVKLKILKHIKRNVLDMN